MKKESDIQKATAALSDFARNTVSIGKKAVSGAKSGLNTLVEKTKADNLARKVKKYNPLFPDAYRADNFSLPNIIIIVDDAVRRGIDVCEGAIGWLGQDAGVEVLYLYDEAVDFSGIQFVPSAACDSVYYIDSFDRNRFIRTDCIFSKAHEEKLAELKHIAYSLGAKKCSIEINESSSNAQMQQKNISLTESYNGKTSCESTEQSFMQKGSNARSGRVEVEFEGNSISKQPTLKWFKHDDNINRLIEMCCSSPRAVKTETIELQGSSSATMSKKTACAIDGVLSKSVNLKGHSSMNAQAEKEYQSKLIYHIEF